METRSARALAAAVRGGDTTAIAATESRLERCSNQDGTINAFHETWTEEAMGRAASIDQRVAAGEDPGPLCGVPIAIKDNIATRSGTTTCGSRMLEGYQSPFDACVVERLEAAGAVLVGKTNCDEFAMGSSTEHCAWGPTRNPWDTSRVPGGSSGGSAAAVSAGFALASIGSDTGGSIRQPASLCGVVGVKPTYGLASRWGLVAFASSLDQIGPFTNDVTDAALMMSTICGFDERDSTSSPGDVPDFMKDLDQPLNALRVGVPSQFLDDRNEPAVNEAIASAIDVFRKLGATIVEVDLPLIDVGISTYYVLAPAEASSNLARYDGIRYGHRTSEANGDLFDLYARSRAEGFGAEVRRRIMLGTYVLSAGYYDAYYNTALKVRRLICREYKAAFEQCDVIAGPASPTVAFELGAKADPISMYLCDVYTANTNIAGIPGMSLPCGMSKEHGTPLPIGLQLQAAWFNDSTMLRAARMYEAAAGISDAAPDLSAIDGVA